MASFQSASVTNGSRKVPRYGMLHWGPLNTLQDILRQFYGSDDPTNSVIALKDDGESARSRANPNRLSSLKGKVENKFYLNTYCTMKTEDTEALGGQRAKPSKVKARSSRPTEFK